MKHPIAILAAVVAATVLAPATALASSVTVEGGVLVLRAAPGELNSVSIDSDDAGALVEINDVDQPSYPAGTCAPAAWDPSGVACSAQPGGIRLELGDRGDLVNVYAGVPGSGPVVILAGDGDDEVKAAFHNTRLEVDGGAGTDTLGGGTAGDVLLGGPGADNLSGAGGGDELRGGDGDDVLLGDDRNAPGADTIDGGPGIDRIDGDWSAPSGQPRQPIDVSLDGQANDGRPGEGDNVTAVEWIHLMNPATLRAGADPVDFEVFNASTASSLLSGSPGPDRLRTYDAADTIEGGAGPDWIEAGYGDDTINGGPGADTINADAGSGACNFLVCRLPQGNDTIDARDGVADSIECGPGEDLAIVDSVDRLSNCETVRVAAVGKGGGCVVPKVKRGAKLKGARAKLRRAGCKAKVVRVRSKLKPGRVVKVAPAAGKALKPGAKVEVRVSRGPARRGAGKAGASSIKVVSPAPRIVNPVKLGCTKLSHGGRVCPKRFKEDWSRGWWSDPAKFEIVDVRIFGDTELTVPYDEYKSFRGEGYSTLRAGKGIAGKFTLPARTAAVPVSSTVAKPVEWKVLSVGAWTTDDGSYDCSVRTQPSQPPTSFAGVVSANPRRGTIGVQWSIVPAGFRCPAEGSISNPEFEGLPAEAMTVQYRASGFRGAGLLKLPIDIEWEGVQESDGARLKLDWTGRVILRRVHHRL